VKGAIITTEVSNEAAALNQQIQVARIDGAGHNIRRENFVATTEALKGFLTGI
jgi:hypothetical protein